MKFSFVNKFIAKVLIISLLLCNSGIYTFAESIDTASDVQEFDSGNSSKDYRVDTDSEIYAGEIEEENGYEDIPEEINEDDADVDAANSYDEVNSEDVENDDSFTSADSIDSDYIEVIDSEVIASDNEVDFDKNSEAGFDNVSLEIDNDDISTLSEFIPVTKDTTETFESDENIFGDGGTSTITLDFLDGKPFYNQSSNWNSVGASGTGYTLTFTGNIGATISEVLRDTYSISIDDIIQIDGNNEYIILPTFDADTLDNYEFLGWFDESDQEVTRFQLLFQENDVTYRVKWKRINSTVTLEFGENKPFYSASNNWNIFNNSLPHNNNHSVKFTGAIDNETLVSVFRNNGYGAGGSAINNIVDNSGMVLLPTFSDGALNGYQFGGWIDSTGNTVTTLPYKFPENDVTYTAKWLRWTTIKIDFGDHAPRASKSKNWNKTIFATMDSLPKVIEFKALENVKVIDYFREKGYYTGTDVEFSSNMIVADGAGKELLLLPKFNNSLIDYDHNAWKGFSTNDEWQASGVGFSHYVKSFDEYFGTIDITYTPNWDVDYSYRPPYTFYVRMVRSTESSLNPSQVTDTMSEYVLAERKAPYQHSVGAIASVVAKDQPSTDSPVELPVNVNGYTFKRVEISIKDFEHFENIGKEGLYTFSHDGTELFKYNSTSLDLNTINNKISGSMPNHDVYIKYIYDLNSDYKKEVKVTFVNEDGIEIKQSQSYNVLTEELVNLPAPDSIDRYEYSNTNIICNRTNLTKGIFGLGYISRPGDIFTEADVTANNGRFKAIMPNQDIVIQHVYIKNQQSITLDFGENRPRVNNTSNWLNSKWNNGNPEKTIEFVGIVSGNPEIIHDKFVNNNYYNGNISEITQEHGIGKHIVLPSFASGLWDGFSFAGWYDSEEKRVTSYNNVQEFSYAFQKSGDAYYTAKWERDGTQQNVFNIKYFRATNSSVWTGPYDSSAAVANHELVNERMETLNHGTYRSVSPISIPGYKIAGVKIFEEPSTVAARTEIGESGLKAKFIDNSYIAFDADDMEMSDDYTIAGKMPNHPLYIEFYYEPDGDDKKDVVIRYYNERGTSEIRQSDIKSYRVEDVIIVSPKEIPSYTYKRALITVTTVDPVRHIFALGDMHTFGEKYTTETVSATDNNGLFKAVMPNQNIYINYYYILEGTNVTVNVRTEKQNDNDKYDVSTNSVVVRIGSPSQVIYIDHLEDKGYGIPNVNMSGITTFDEPEYNYNSTEADAAGRGKLYYHVDDPGTPLITIKYAYDRTNTNYWSKLSFNYKDPAAGGKGTITNAPNTKILTERYLRKNTASYQYTLNDIVKDVVVTPDENYLCIWRHGTNDTADAIPTTGNVSILDSTYYLYADFVEDPSKWIDVTFAASEHSNISGIAENHIPKNTARNSITFPTVTPDQGYRHAINATTGNPIWIDTEGHELGDSFVATMSYVPLIEANFNGSATPVKPVVHVTYDSEGFGIANLYGVYTNRKYVLTDRSDKILYVKDAIQAKNGFDNLVPGTTYHMYEVLNGVNVNVGERITASANVSEKYLFGVKALLNKPALIVNNDTYAISVPTKTNVEYALLDDRYNVVNDFTTSLSASGLTKGTYYLVVARAAGDTVSANDDSAIRNGYVVYTTSNNLENKKYKLLFFGTGNIGGAGTGTNMTTDPAGVVYEVAAGKNVRVTGANGYTTFILSNNVVINNDADAVSPYQKKSTNISFVMPEEDVIVHRLNISETVTNTSGSQVPNTITVYSNGGKLSVLDIEAIKDELNDDNVIKNDAIDNDCDVNHYIEINRYATKKSKVTALSDSVLSPYEYTIDVQSIVLGVPYRVSNFDDVYFDAYLALDKEMLENSLYKLENADLTSPYTTTDESEKGTAAFELNIGVEKAVSYKKMHSIKIVSDTVSGGLQYELDMTVNDSTLLSSADNFATLKDNKLKDLFDNATNPANKKEYIYKGLFDGDSEFNIDTVKINTAKNLTIHYELNQDRENKKTELSDELLSAGTKLGTLIDTKVIASLSDAISKARAIRNDQVNKTVAELEQATLVLRNAKNAAKDPGVEGEIVVINIDANGGVSNTETIEVTAGNSSTYKELSIIEISRDNYTFKEWNSLADGKGIAIASTSIVGLTPPETLYAIWIDGSKPSPSPRPSGGGNRGGGGGGGGGISRQEVLLDKQYNLYPNANVGGYDPQIPVYLQAITVHDEGNTGFFIMFDQATNTFSMKIGNRDTKESYKNRWVEVIFNDGTTQIFRLDVNGNIISGKYFDDFGRAFYLRDQNDKTFGTLATGWVQDTNTKEWYYANPQTGALTTGWQRIGDKDYYFYNPSTEKTTDVLGYIAQYGVMLTNCEVEPGYVLDASGALIKANPHRD